MHPAPDVAVEAELRMGVTRPGWRRIWSNSVQAERGKRAHAGLIFLLLLTCYGYFIPKLDDSDWVATSRADLTFAVVDQGVVYIDDYHTNTGDKAFFQGHYYTVASIGPSLVAVPIYGTFKAVTSLHPISRRVFELRDPQARAKYQNVALIVITFLAVSVPAASIGVLVFLFASRFTTRQNDALLLALIYGLATVAFPYSRTFHQHQIAAFGAFLGFYLLWRVIYEGGAKGWLWVVGALFSLAAISEYPLALFVGVLCGWALYELSDWRALYRLVIGGVPLVLLSAAYNVAAFGTPIPVGYRYHVIHEQTHAQGLMGLTVPSLQALYGITVSPYRGLLFMSPVLVLALPGLYLMWRQAPRYRSAVITLVLIIGGFLAYNSAYAIWWGGSAIGPRFLVPMIPFLVLPISLVFNRWLGSVGARTLVGALTIASFLNVWTQTIAGQYYPPASMGDPLGQYALPLLAEGEIARNYGMLLGFRGPTSLLPLLAAVLGMYLLTQRGWMGREQRVRPAQSYLAE